ncbi:MFS transporter [Streptantibioticus rubrisoli]|uniref:MFS transporter n=1 Tax=Streptantibioticus rubrisoli TaxID=1387313 RepID=A0ABT1P911_9ACTN|nr:MFS transporter [Streptantibioticus rubrisoli]MCQ4041852.1 MFS transporter [Streptantibioticus rubrisoli]
MSGRFHALMSCLFLSSLGIGMVFPLTSIYVSDVLGLGPAGAGRYFIAMAVASCTAAISGGPRADRRGAAVGAVGCGSLVTGYAVLGAAHGTVAVAAAGAFAGIGFGLQYAAITEVVNGLVPESLNRRAFTVRHVMTNVGMGLGGALGGLLLLTGERDSGTLRLLYEGSAAASVPLAVAFWALRRRGRTSGERRGRRADPVSYRGLLSDRRLVFLLLSQAVLAGAGFTQLESSVPWLLNHWMSIGLPGVSALIACNAFALLVLQRPVGALCERLPESVALVAAPALWCLAFGFGAVAALCETPYRQVALAGFAVAFALGEVCYSSAFFPLLVRFAGESALGRAGALASLGWSAGTATGPPLGLALIGGHGAVAGWLLLVAGSVLACLPPALVHFSSTAE